MSEQSIAQLGAKNAEAWRAYEAARDEAWEEFRKVCDVVHWIYAGTIHEALRPAWEEHCETEFALQRALYGR